MRLTLNKAAQACGRSKSTLLQAINSGRLSAPKDDRGHYSIDPAELHRAFPFQMNDRPEPVPTEQPKPSSTTLENTVLQREIELLREMLMKAETTAEHWRLMAERQQALEDKRHKNFFSRLWKQK